MKLAKILTKIESKNPEKGKVVITFYPENNTNLTVNMTASIGVTRYPTHEDIDYATTVVVLFDIYTATYIPLGVLVDYSKLLYELYDKFSEDDFIKFKTNITNITKDRIEFEIYHPFKYHNRTYEVKKYLRMAVKALKIAFSSGLTNIYPRYVQLSQFLCDNIEKELEKC